jgi:hypothetical protein
MNTQQINAQPKHVVVAPEAPETIYRRFLKWIAHSKDKADLAIAIHNINESDQTKWLNSQQLIGLRAVIDAMTERMEYLSDLKYNAQ